MCGTECSSGQLPNASHGNAVTVGFLSCTGDATGAVSRVENKHGSIDLSAAEELLRRARSLFQSS